jgi:aldehyde dehydrogenase (NAD+)
MLVPAARMDEAIEAARGAALRAVPGDPTLETTAMGPVVSKVQFDKIQALIEAGIAEGATLVTGGPGLPDGMNKGYFVRPTIFANVNNDMTIAREEVFGPVLTILGYRDEDDAIAIANDTPYGLSGYVSSTDLAHAGRVAARLRTGNVHINNAPGDQSAPFGGYKQSGNGREWGDFGFEEYLEVKAVMGAVAAE